MQEKKARPGVFAIEGDVKKWMQSQLDDAK